MQYHLRQIKDLQPGDHLCLIYATEAEHRAVLTPFLRQGLESGDKVIYIVDARTGETVLGYLREDGVDADAYMQSGQLVILEVDAAYMREGVFDPDGMIQLLRSETDKALAEGYRALRASGEMSWALRELPGSERLIEYEAKLNDFFPGSQCLALCQYDRRRFTSNLLLEVMTTHPMAVIGTEIYDNSYYLPPKDMLGLDPDSARLTNWIRNLQDRKGIEEALQSRAIRLDERLRCLYRIADLVGTPGIALSTLLQRVVDLIPPAWQYPEVTGASISLEGEEFKTKNFRETPWKLVSAIKVEGREAGRLQVHYLEARPQADEGPFQGEERQLIDAIAERLGRIIERLRAEQGLGVRNRIADIFLMVPNDEMFGAVLQIVLEVMDSAYGIFGYLDEDGTMVCPSMTRDVWEKCQVPDKTIRFPRETRGDSIWGRAISEKSSFYSNEPGRVPEGHVPIHRVLAVPILFQGEVLGQVVVADKSTDYGVRDQEKLEAIAGYIAPVLQARLQRDREDQARRRAEEAVAAERQRFFSMLETMPAYLGLLTPDYQVAFANRHFKERFGEPGGRRCYEYMFGLSEPCENCQAYKVLETGTPQKYEWLGPDGGTYQIYDQLMHDTDGSPLILEMGIDITDRKLAEEALRQANETLRATLDAAPVAIFDLDTEGRVKSLWNAAAEQMLGWRRDEVIGHFLPTVPEDSKDEFAGFREWIRSGKPIKGQDVVRRRKNGSPLEYSIYADPVFDEDGKVIGNIAALMDITKRKEAEQERLAHLRFFENMDQVNRAMLMANDLEQMMRNALDAVLAIFACDRAWLVYPCDPEAPTWRVQMERTRPEYPGAFALELEFPMDADAISVIQAVLAASGPVTFGPGSEHPLAAEVAQRFSYQSQISMAIYPQGEKPYMFGLHQCSYPRVWTAEEVQLLQEIGRRLTDALTSLLIYRNLRDSEQKYRLLVNQIPAVVFKGYADWSIDFFDHKLETITGYPKEDFDSRKLKWSDLILPEDLPEAKAKFLEALKGDKSYLREYRIRKKTGDIRWVQNLGQIFCDAGGEIDYVSGIFFDITDRKQAEESLRRVTRALKTLSLCNEVVVRAVEETALLQDICRIIVEVGGYGLAWVGFAQDDESKTVRPEAWAGIEAGFFDTSKLSWGGDQALQTPGGIAIANGRTCVVRDISEEAYSPAWQAEAVRRGVASAIGLPLRLNDQTIGALTIDAHEANAFDADEVKLLEELASDISFGIKALRTSAARRQAEAQLRESLERVRKIMDEVVQVMALTVEIRDPYTGGHQQRVTQLALAIAQEMGLDENRIEGLRVAGFLHDIGKITVPAEILSKPGKLSETEFGIIKGHAQAGYQILTMVSFPWPVAQIVLQHHERLNGSGYPQGLHEADILQETKILTVADVVEAMASHRPYRPGLGVEKALEEITKNKGILYDPEVVGACVKLFRERGFTFE
jgi:PAS domain S-box-containing protein/putative nucleotidyltransferase with HDIG domain